MFVQCDFTEANFITDYFAAIYDGDVKDSKAEKRQKKATDGGDVYVIDDYKPPKYDFGQVLGISIIGLIGFFFGLVN